MRLVERTNPRVRRIPRGDEGGPAKLESASVLSLCTLVVDGQLFCLDSSRIREVLGERRVAAIPLAPAFLAGVVPYRGEVLTTVSFRALLGLAPFDGPGCILVLEPRGAGDTLGEPFGLLADGVGGVVSLKRESLEANPTTFDERSRALFCGAFPLPEGLLVRLSPDLLEPGRLAANPLFSRRGTGSGGVYEARSTGVSAASIETRESR